MTAGDVVERLPDCVLVVDRFGVIRYANRVAEEEFGYRAEEWVGQTVLKLIDQDDVAVVLSSMETVRSKRIGTPVEVRVRDAWGVSQLCEVIGRLVVLADGVPGILCAVRNITRRRMWEVVSGDVQLFQQLVQVAPAIILLLDVAGVVSSVNAAFTRMLGHDPSVVIGRPLLNFVVEEDAERVDAELASLAAGNRSAVFEARMRVVGQGEEVRPVRFELVSQLGDPVLDGIVVSGYDVSELTSMREQSDTLPATIP